MAEHLLEASQFHMQRLTILLTHGSVAQVPLFGRLGLLQLLSELRNVTLKRAYSVQIVLLAQLDLADFLRLLAKQLLDFV